MLQSLRVKIAITACLLFLLIAGFRYGQKANKASVLGVYTEQESSRIFDNASAADFPSIEQSGDTHRLNSVNGQIISAEVSGVFDRLAEININSETHPLPRIYQAKFPAIPEFKAKSILVFDSKTGFIAFSKNPNEKLSIASLTKLMTAVVAKQDSGFENKITITEKDQIEISPTLHLKAGEEVYPLDILRAMMVGSANDAAQTLANHFNRGSNFVDLMNEQARALDMSDTNFGTPIGFDVANNHSTAGDLKKLIEYSLKLLPYSDFWQKRSYTFKSEQGNSYRINNSNQIIGGSYDVKSLKTGLSPEALGNMIVMANNKKGNSVVAIVLGSSDRNADTKVLLDYIFKNFAWE